MFMNGNNAGRRVMASIGRSVGWPESSRPTGILHRYCGPRRLDPPYRGTNRIAVAARGHLRVARRIRVLVPTLQRGNALLATLLRRSSRAASSPRSRRRSGEDSAFPRRTVGTRDSRLVGPTGSRTARRMVCGGLFCVSGQDFALDLKHCQSWPNSEQTARHRKRGDILLFTK